MLLLVLGSMFVLSAFAKLVDPGQAAEFARYTFHGEGMPAYIWSIVVVGLVGTEAWFGLQLLLGPRNRRFLALVAVTLILFTAALGRAFFDTSAPSCGCFGAFAAQANQEAGIGIVRNVGLIFMTTWLLIESPARQKPTPSPDERQPKVSGLHASTCPSTRGFTLLELLVVIAIIAVLIGILVPVIGAARRKADGVSTTSMMRQASAALAIYAGDYKDAFPYLATPGQPDAPITVGQYTIAHGGYFGIQTKFWTARIVPDYLDVLPKSVSLHDGKPSSWVIGPAGSEGLRTSRYWLTHAAHAAPAFWDDEPSTDTSLLRGMKLTDVAFPSQKATLLDVLAGAFAKENHNNEERDTAYVGLADGSAKGENWTALIDAERYVILKPHGAVGWPILSTRSGLAGIDF